MKVNKDIRQTEEGKILTSINKEDTFSVPSNYFEDLPQSVMSRVHSESKQKEPFFLLKPSIVIPSFTITLCGLLFLFIFFFNKNRPISLDENIFSDSEVQQVIDNADLYNIDEAKITAQYISSPISDEYEDDETAISDGEIKSYLEEYTDVNTIINEIIQP